MGQFNGHTIYEARDGVWSVGVLLNNGLIAIYAGTPKYASEASATLEAKRRHAERPHMNFAAVRA